MLAIKVNLSGMPNFQDSVGTQCNGNKIIVAQKVTMTARRKVQLEGTTIVYTGDHSCSSCTPTAHY